LLLRPAILGFVIAVVLAGLMPFGAHGSGHAEIAKHGQEGVPETALLPVADDVSDSAINMEPVLLGYVNFPPHSYFEDGKAKGPYLLGSIKILERANLSYELVELPVARLYKEIANGKVHVWTGISGHAGHDRATIMDDTPIGILKLRIYGVGSPPPTFENLRNTALIVIGGYQYAGLLRRQPPADRGVTLIPAQSHRSAFELMSVGRARYVMDYDQSAQQAISALGLGDVKATVVEDVPIYYYVSRAAPDPEGLLKIMQDGRKVLHREQKK